MLDLNTKEELVCNEGKGIVMLNYNEFIAELKPDTFEGSGHDLISNSFVAGEYCKVRAFALYSMVCTIGYGEGILINAESYEEALFELTILLNPVVREKKNQRRKNKAPQRRRRIFKNIFGRRPYRHIRRYKRTTETRKDLVNFKPLPKGFLNWTKTL